MKKRNVPFVLLTFLILLVGMAAFMNASARSAGDGHQHGQGPEQAPEQAPPTQGAPRESTTSPEALAQKAGQAVGGPSPMAPGPRGGPDAPPQKPLIAPEKPAAPSKPTPSESSIGSQWYTNEGAKDYSKK